MSVISFTYLSIVAVKINSPLLYISLSIKTGSLLDASLPEWSLLAMELVGVGECDTGSGSSIAIGHFVGLYFARNCKIQSIIDK